MMANIDYAAYVEFMWYNKRFMPHRINLVPVSDSSRNISIQVDHAPLVFSYYDVVENLRLPHPLFGPEEPVDFRKQLQDLPHFLTKEFVPLLFDKHGGNLTVATTDMASWMYLKEYIENIMFLGAELLREKMNVLTDFPEGIEICKAVADKLFAMRPRNIII